MNKWTPITFEELMVQIQKSECEMDAESKNIWESIKTEPEKWEEKTYGEEGNGFWVVAIYDNSIIWYNDIEEGFNTSDFAKWGVIESYSTYQEELCWSLQKLLHSQNLKNRI